MKRLTLTVCAFALAIAPTSLSAQAAPLTEPDPVRLEAAQVTVAHIFPSGTYARIMKRTMDGVMGTMMDSFGDLLLRDLAAVGGKSPDELEKMGEGTLKEMMEILDPAYDQRMRLTMQVMSQEMTTLMTQFEPSFQDGLARAYAKRFTVAQLNELNSFFSTPTGQAYAAESMVIMTDPEVMKKMTEIMPAMMKQMPAITQKLKDAMAGLPEPRKPEDLSPEEKARLAELLGVPVEKLGTSDNHGLVEVE